MKSTGITRRIDDLGRIVIPKEIRKNLKIKENETLEIFIENESIILRKYSSFNDMDKILENFIDVLNQITLGNIIITDRDKVIATIKTKNYDYLDKELSEYLIDIILKRESKLSNDNEEIEITLNNKINACYYIKPIIKDSDALGSVILFKNKNIGENDKLSVDIISKLIVNYLG